MIKTLIGFSDIHLRPLKRHEEYKVVFNTLINEVKDERPDRIVIAGDIFHSKLTISNESSLIVAKLLNALSKYSKIVIIPGNHDTVLESNRVDSITPIIEIMNNDHIVYYKESGCFEDKWDKDVVWCVWSCLEQQNAPDIKAYKASNDPQGDKHYIGLYHGVINGSTTDLGFTFTDEGVESADFFDTDIFIAGDIHKHQTYKYPNYKGEGWGIMLGSLIQQHYGEGLENHGYNLLEYQQNRWNHKLVEIDNDHDYHTLHLTDYEKLTEL
jgi:DNA repair exonuclease SbcCD nuclease subunit